jgi:quercetin dioxygenase-like cupin family protein
MTERRLADRLDASLETLMADPSVSLPRVGPKLAELLRIAQELRGLPDPRFRSRLAAELSAAVSGAGAPREPAAELPTFDLAAALDGVPELGMRFLAELDRCTLGVSRLSTVSHWERHPDGDELLHLLAGDADVTTLTDAGPIRSYVPSGSIFVCPRGLWHRVEPRSPVSMFFATPGAGIEHSSAADPRHGGEGESRADAAELVAHDLDAALATLPTLAIGAGTSRAQADSAFRMLASFNQCKIGLARFSGLTPWERHPDGDELLHALEGDVEITLLTDDGPRRRTLRQGHVFVCPRGLWHRQLPHGTATILFATATATSEASFAADPRTPTREETRP